MVRTGGPRRLLIAAVDTVPTVVASPDGAHAYVTNFWHGTVSVLDLDAKRIRAQIATGSGTEGIGISPDGRYIYTSSVYINEIVRVDTSTLEIVGRAVMQDCLGAVRVVPTAAGDTPDGIAFLPN